MPIQQIDQYTRTMFPEGPSNMKDGSITEDQFHAEHGHWPDDPTFGLSPPRRKSPTNPLKDEGAPMPPLT